MHRSLGCTVLRRSQDCRPAALSCNSWSRSWSTWQWPTTVPSESRQNVQCCRAAITRAVCLWGGSCRLHRVDLHRAPARSLKNSSSSLPLSTVNSFLKYIKSIGRSRVMHDAGRAGPPQDWAQRHFCRQSQQQHQIRFSGDAWSGNESSTLPQPQPTSENSAAESAAAAGVPCRCRNTAPPRAASVLPAAAHGWHEGCSTATTARDPIAPSVVAVIGSRSIF